MGMRFHKWLLLSVMPILLVTARFLPSSFHPFHVSTVEIDHNAGDKSLEITCRIFTDDFEAGLEKQFNAKADFSNSSLKVTMDNLVNKYIGMHLAVKADGKACSFKYVGFEIENEAVNAYFEVDNIPTVKKVEVTNSILHNLYDDQISIIHVIVGGNRKSTKLDYPATNAVFAF